MGINIGFLKFYKKNYALGKFFLGYIERNQKLWQILDLLGHYERAMSGTCLQSYGTRSVPTTLNVYLFLEFTKCVK